MFGVDEIDILKCRLTEVEDEDVTHVLVEATLNHRGRPKPLYYADNKSEFERWNDRIVHVIVTDLDPSDTSAWGRENAQREASWRGLTDANPDDVIIHSDCDEVLTANAISTARKLEGPGWRFRLRHLMYAIDWEVIGGQPMDQTITSRLKNISGFTEVRRGNSFPVAPPELGPMGWHLSSLGGPDAIRRKLTRDCHPELTQIATEWIDKGLLYEKGVFPFDVGKAQPVDVDDTWPRYVTSGKAPAIWYRPREQA